MVRRLWPLAVWLFAFVCLLQWSDGYAQLLPLEVNRCPSAVQSALMELHLWNKSTSTNSQLHYVPKGCVVVDYGGYWRMEVCPGRWIRQLRVDDGVVVQQNILGVQSRWNLPDEAGTAQVQFADGLATVPDIIRQITPVQSRQNLLWPYSPSVRSAWWDKPNDYTCKLTTDGLVIRAQYDNGTICEANRRPRKTTLELVCAEGVPFPRVRVKELVVCEYLVILTASEVCTLLNYDRGEEQHLLNLRFGFRDVDVRLSL